MELTPSILNHIGKVKVQNKQNERCKKDKFKNLLSELIRKHG